MQCPTVKRNRAAQNEATRSKRSEDESGDRSGRPWPLCLIKRPN